MSYSENNIRPICLDLKDPERATMLSIITAKSCARIRIEDVEYIEQAGRKLELMTNDLQYSVYENIENLIPYFRSQSFFRVMKSIFINFDRVRSIEEDTIYFESGKSISMGRNNICRTRNAFKKYLRQYQIHHNEEPKLMVAEANS